MCIVINPPTRAREIGVVRKYSYSCAETSCASTCVSRGFRAYFPASPSRNVPHHGRPKISTGTSLFGTRQNFRANLQAKWRSPVEKSNPNSCPGGKGLVFILMRQGNRRCKILMVSVCPILMQCSGRTWWYGPQDGNRVPEFPTFLQVCGTFIWDTLIAHSGWSIVSSGAFA